MFVAVRDMAEANVQQLTRFRKCGKRAHFAKGCALDGTGEQLNEKGKGQDGKGNCSRSGNKEYGKGMKCSAADAECKNRRRVVTLQKCADRFAVLLLRLDLLAKVFICVVPQRVQLTTAPKCANRKVWQALLGQRQLAQRILRPETVQMNLVP